jgi:hypothetical protein
MSAATATAVKVPAPSATARLFMTPPATGACKRKPARQVGMPIARRPRPSGRRIAERSKYLTSQRRIAARKHVAIIPAD